MIRTLVVDDDFMSASIHASYVERLEEFVVVGQAHTGAQALEQVRQLHPDLVLLDIYLPDLGGLEVMRRLRLTDATVDVIAVTAAKDVPTVREAMRRGVVHYIVKPFVYDTFRERLERYAALKGRLERMREANQSEIDQLFSLLRAQGASGLPKGISAPTLGLVAEVIRDADAELTAVEVAEQAGISRGTARRYLEYLASLGRVELRLRYGTTGRPEHLFRAPAVTARHDARS